MRRHVGNELVCIYIVRGVHGDDWNVSYNFKCIQNITVGCIHDKERFLFLYLEKHQIIY
jgi:hypothetical protein